MEGLKMKIEQRLAPNSNDKTENTSDEAEKNEHNSKCMLRMATEQIELNEIVRKLL